MVEVKPHSGSGFWEKRLATHGHTGWSDPILYAYDQIERLDLIKRAILQKPVKNEVALDFGCGTGDFSRLLLTMGFAVWGYDPFVKTKIPSTRFTHLDNCQDIPRTRSANLALSVTTLDHILDETDVGIALAAIRDFLRRDGVFYMVEYAFNSEMDRDRLVAKNEYQSFRTLAQWEKLLAQSSFQILDVASIPHPSFNPSKGYQTYARGLLARLGRKCQRFPFLKPGYELILKWRSAILVKRFPFDLANAAAAAPLKLFRCSVVQ